MLRFRTAKEDVSGVFLVAEGREEIQMEKASSHGIFDYYETTWQLGEETFCYYFKIVSGDEICYFTRYGVSDNLNTFYQFRIAPGFSTPDWAKGAVMYQISWIVLQRRSTNDVESREYIYIGARVRR